MVQWCGREQLQYFRTHDQTCGSQAAKEVLVFLSSSYRRYKIGDVGTVFLRRDVFAREHTEISHEMTWRNKHPPRFERMFSDIDPNGMIRGYTTE